MNAGFLLKRKFRATGVGLLAALALTSCGIPSAGSWGDGLEQTGLPQEDPAEAAGDETEGADGMSAVGGTQDVESGLSQGTDGGTREEGSAVQESQVPSWGASAAAEPAIMLAEYAQLLPAASRKSRYTQPALDVLAGLPEEKPESALRQRDVDCDTLQWFNATYAMFIEGLNRDYHFMGGTDDSSGRDRDYIVSQLKQSWGISDRESATETLYWLLSSGHAEGFAEDIQVMAYYGWLELPEEEMRREIMSHVDGESMTEENMTALADYFVREQAVYAVCGKNGIDAWDYCRFMQIAANSYYAGYLTLEESLELQLETAKAIQQQFSSWEEMNQSYLQGYIFWVDNSTAAYLRERAYERLQKAEDSPYKTLDFQMTLEKFW